MRIAAHKSRSVWSTAKPAAPVPNWTAASSRAAQAAARVAARYAQAPSFSQMLAADALPAQRATAIATVETAKAAVAEQQALAESPLASTSPRLLELEALQSAIHTRPSVLDREPAVALLHPVAPSSLEEWETGSAYTCWEPDLRLLPLNPVPMPIAAPAPVAAQVAASVVASESWPAEEFASLAAASAAIASPIIASSVIASPVSQRWEWPALAEQLSESDEIVPVEPDLPIHANLIEFPRELVATRKMRPRRAEGPYAVARPEMQLSIFEVDPDAISTLPENTGAAAVAVWPEPTWAEIELDPQVREDVESQEMPVAQPALHLAPIGERLRAALTDGALIACVILIPALIAARWVDHLHATKIVELGAAATVLFVGLLYHALFLILAGTTPGMKLAGISLCTFDGQIPTREQLRSRLGALLLSLIPVGLGMAWALFDDDRLCWHDRLSRTYPRMNC